MKFVGALENINSKKNSNTNLNKPNKSNLTSPRPASNINMNGASSLPSSCSPSPSSSSSLSSSSTSNSNSATLKSLLDSKEKDKQLASNTAFISSITSSTFKPISNLKSSYLRAIPNTQIDENLLYEQKNEKKNSSNTDNYDSSNEIDTEIDNSDNLSSELISFHSKRQRQSNSSTERGATSPTCSSPLNNSINLSSNNNNALSNYEPLNTADIAQKVRDLLSLHNIGQRIFAKFILGLSQGTVSELLSKPKHWDKLTEKGRESYRKMYSWSCSEQSINTLKAISPRKGNKDNYFYQNGGKEDSATEEKIAQILFEAQKQMQAKDRNLNVSFF